MAKKKWITDIRIIKQFKNNQEFQNLHYIQNLQNNLNNKTKIQVMLNQKLIKNKLKKYQNFNNQHNLKNY